MKIKFFIPSSLTSVATGTVPYQTPKETQSSSQPFPCSGRKVQAESYMYTRDLRHHTLHSVQSNEAFPKNLLVRMHWPHSCVPTPLLIEMFTIPWIMYSSLAWPDPIPHRGKRSGIWPQTNLSHRNLISHVNPAMTSHGNRANDGKTCDLSAPAISILLCSS